MEEEDVRRDRGLSAFGLCAVSRLTSVVGCTGIGCSVSTQVSGFWFAFGWCCVLFDSAWWNRGIAEEVTMASNSKAVTGTAVMARSANEEKKNSESRQPRVLKSSRTILSVCVCVPSLHTLTKSSKNELQTKPHKEIPMHFTAWDILKNAPTETVAPNGIDSIRNTAGLPLVGSHPSQVKVIFPYSYLPVCFAHVVGLSNQT